MTPSYGSTASSAPHLGTESLIAVGSTSPSPGPVIIGTAPPPPAVVSGPRVCTTPSVIASSEAAFPSAPLTGMAPPFFGLVMLAFPVGEPPEGEVEMGRGLCVGMEESTMVEGLSPRSEPGSVTGTIGTVGEGLPGIEGRHCKKPQQARKLGTPN